MKVFVYQKFADGEFDMAVFNEQELTQDRDRFYKDNGYMMGVHDTVADWMGSLTDTNISDGECLDMLIELCDKGFIEGSIRND